MDKRVNSIERRLDVLEQRMQTQFYWLLGIILGTSLLGHFWK
jgi:hypothetical protein